MGEVIRKTKNGRALGWYIRWVDLDGKRKTRASKQPTFAEAKRKMCIRDRCEEELDLGGEWAVFSGFFRHRRG